MKDQGPKQEVVMKARFVGMLLLTLASAALITSRPHAVGGEKKKEEQKKDDAVQLPLGNSAWDLKGFSKQPVKVVKTTYDPKADEVRWVLEFTKDLSDEEVARWSGDETPFLFRCWDEDQVVIQTLRARKEGELLARNGTRIRIVLPLPEKNVFEKLRKIVVE
jgi:hypothetical protein